MKYCTKCGAELHDEAVICPKCGCKVEQPKTVYKKPQEIDVPQNELCPQSFFWPWFMCYIFSFVLGFLAFFEKLVLGNMGVDLSAGFITACSVISIVCFIPSIVMTVIGNNKKWKHYQFGSKTYPVKFLAGFIFGPIGLILAIIAICL